MTFLEAHAVEAEVGIDLVGLVCHNACDLVSADVPKFVDGFVAKVHVAGALGDSDEVVDGGVGGVCHGRFPCW